MTLQQREIFSFMPFYSEALFENDVFSLLPEVFLIFSSLSLLAFAVVFSTTERYPLLTGNISWLSIYTLFWALSLLQNSPIKNGVLINNTLVIDPWTQGFKLLLLCGALFCFLISPPYRINSFELPILLLLSTTAMLFLISSWDLVTLYLAMEWQSLCLYVMAASKRGSEFSTEAGLKYFLLGAFSSGLLLFGSSLVYGFTGCTCFHDLGQLLAQGSLSSWRGCELGLIFVIVGLLFKLTAVPFHMWAPDVYEGAPTQVTAFFAIAPKIAFLAVLSKVLLEGFYDLAVSWQTILIFCSFGSMIIGSFAAMAQTKMKRLLAYSSIGHVGFMLIGLCSATTEGLQALCFYLVVYVVMTINLFALLLCPLRRGVIPWIQQLKYTTDLAELGKTHPALAFTVSMTLFSMAGIPPLAGFFSKAYLFFVALSSSLYLLAVIGVLCSVVSCYYYIRIIKIMYFETPINWLTFLSLPRESSYALALTTLFIILLVSYPSPLFLYSHKLALVVCL